MRLDKEYFFFALLSVEKGTLVDRLKTLTFLFDSRRRCWLPEYAQFHRREISHADLMLGYALGSNLAGRGASTRMRACPGMDSSTWRIPQSKPEPGPTSAAGVEKQESPPMQETAVTEEPTPFYKKGWFWTILVVLAVVVAVAASFSTGESEGVVCTRSGCSQ